MILVLLGTNPYPFTRLLRAVEELALHSTQRIVVQTGNTPIPASLQPNMECYDFVEYSQISGWIAEADVVISQGGYGSLSDSIKQNTPTIAVPRKISLNECKDDQTELVNVLVSERLVIAVNDVSALAGAVNQARSFKQKVVVGASLPIHLSNVINNILSR